MHALIDAWMDNVNALCVVFNCSKGDCRRQSEPARARAHTSTALHTRKCLPTTHKTVAQPRIHGRTESGCGAWGYDDPSDLDEHAKIEIDEIDPAFYSYTPASASEDDESDASSDDAGSKAPRVSSRAY